MDRSERQELGISKWIANKCHGTALYPTGFGKTTTAFKAIERFLSKNPTRKILVVVPTDYLKEQWLIQVVNRKLFQSVDVKVINTVVKQNWNVDMLVLDEIHTMAADTFYKVFEKVKYKIILGLTGTIDRLDGKQTLLTDKCPIIDSITMEEAIGNGWLSPYVEYKVLIEPDDLDVYRKHHQDFMKYFAKFNFDFKLAMECVSGRKVGTKVVMKAFQVQYEYAKSLCSLPIHHPNYKSTVSELFAEIKASAYAWNKALRDRKDYVMNHPKKVEIAKQILNARLDKKCITFSATKKAAEEINIGHVLHSGQTKKKRGITKDEFDALETGVLNTSKALDCGADIPGLNVGVILCNTSSSIQKRQRLGRVIRFAPNKKAELFTLVLKGTMEEQWFTKSTGKMHYVPISEDQLKKVLNNESIDEISESLDTFDFNL